MWLRFFATTHSVSLQNFATTHNFLKRFRWSGVRVSQLLLYLMRIYCVCLCVQWCTNQAGYLKDGTFFSFFFLCREGCIFPFVERLFQRSFFFTFRRFCLEVVVFGAIFFLGGVRQIFCPKYIQFLGIFCFEKFVWPGHRGLFVPDISTVLDLLGLYPPPPPPNSSQCRGSSVFLVDCWLSAGKLETVCCFCQFPFSQFLPSPRDFPKGPPQLLSWTYVALKPALTGQCSCAVLGTSNCICVYVVEGR